MKTVREILEEEVKDPVAAIARMTARNDHGGALLAAAEWIGAKKLVERLRLVKKLHELEGDLPADLDKYRYALRQELKAAAQKKLGTVEFERLWGAM